MNKISFYFIPSTYNVKFQVLLGQGGYKGKFIQLTDFHDPNFR